MNKMWTFLLFSLFLMEIGSAIREDKCPQWQTHGEKCYKFINENLGSEFNSLNTLCGYDDGYIAMIKSKDIQDFVMGELNKKYKHEYKVWIGLNYIQNKNKYVWLDGSELVYENFDKSLKELGNIGMCVTLDPKTGKWHNEVCNKTDQGFKFHGGLCEYPIERIPFHLCPATLTRDKYLKMLDNKCYYFYLNTKKNYAEAQEICQKDGGMLTSIKTKKVNDFIDNQLSDTFSFTEDAWIGLSDRKQEGEFVWEDGSKLDYEDFHFKSGIHNDEFLRDYQDCVVFNTYLGYTTSGKWYDKFCKDNFFQKGRYNFICEYPLVQKN